MAIVFITLSTDGLGRAAALSLLDQGHRVVQDARATDRFAALGELPCGRLRRAASSGAWGAMPVSRGRLSAVERRPAPAFLVGPVPCVQVAPLGQPTLSKC